jgi:hypothetical protein
VLSCGAGLKVGIMPQNGYSFHVGNWLGIGPTSSKPLPEAREGEIVLRISEGISLIGLRDSEVGRALMHRQDWYEKYDWCRQVFPVGTYRLLVPVPETFGKNFAEQQELLGEGEEAAPVALVAVALLCMQQSGHPDPLDDNWSRCGEPSAPGYRVALQWRHGSRFIVDNREDVRIGFFGLSALLKS